MGTPYLPPLYNLHLGWFKLLKTRFISYISSDAVIVEQNGKHDTYVHSIRNSVLLICNTMLISLQNIFPIPGGNEDFKKTEPSSALKGLLMKGGFKGMSEGKEYVAVVDIPPSVSAFAHGCLGRIENYEETTVHRMYTQLPEMVTGAVTVYIGKPVTAYFVESLVTECNWVVV